MDRFIDYLYDAVSSAIDSLKSNMDRFIVSCLTVSAVGQERLKSNMDRFIGCIYENYL